MVHSALVLAGVFALGRGPTTTQSKVATDSIHRFAPAVFRQLPASIRRDLENRNCLVPQPWDYKTPQNVIRGAFTAARVSEWAVLCSVRGTSQILIYGSGTDRAHVVDSLKRSSDESWMQGIGGDRSGYSRLIQTLPRRKMRDPRSWRVDADRKAIPQPIDHDAIEEVFIEKAAEAFYFAAGKWYRQITAD